MKYFRHFVAVALVISVIMNYVLLSKVLDLEYQVNSLLDLQNQLMQNVTSQTSNIENVMNEFKKEQSWISTIDSFSDTKESKAEITFEWQIKELHDNSDVVFNYSSENGKEYTEVPAINKGNGLFYVTIPVDVKIEPHWEVQLNSTGNQVGQINEKEIEDRKFDRYKMKYFVAVSYNDIVQSSEIHTMNLGNIGSKDYGLLDAIVELSNNEYFVSVSNTMDSSENIIPLKKVSVMKYQDGKLVDEEQLISDDSDLPKNEPVFFRMKKTEKLEYTRLVLKAVYSNGNAFEKEIYTKK